MYHNQNHNPFEDLMMISASNSGQEIQKQASVEEEVNPYFAQGMNEEFQKIAAEKAKAAPVKPTTKPAVGGKKKTSPTARAMEKAKGEITRAGNQAAQSIQKDEDKKLKNSLLFGN